MNVLINYKRLNNISGKYCFTWILFLLAITSVAQQSSIQTNLITNRTKNKVVEKAHTKNSVSAIGNFITLTVLGNALSDNTQLGFCPNGTTSFDSGIDTLKAANTNTASPVISTVLGNLDYQKNYLPATINSLSIPIRVTVGATGKYILLRDSSLILAQGSCMFLEDVSMNYTLDFMANASYSFTIEDTTILPRFILHITEPVSRQSINTSCSYNQNGVAIIKGPVLGNYNSIWKDNLGNVLTMHNNVVGNDSLKNLAPGKYPFSITSSLNSCLSVSDTVLVMSATAINIAAIITDEKCTNSSTGQIDASNVSGGNGPYNYLWSNASLSAINNQLSAGVYILYLTDANGCKDTTIYTVHQLSNLNAAFTTNVDTVMMSSPIINFTNQSSGYTSVLWNFGDGNTSNSVNPTHQYLSPGTFTVELSTFDSYCIEKFSKTVCVLNTTGIGTHALQEEIKIMSAGNHAKVRFDLLQEEAVLVNVYNMEGKLLNSLAFNTRNSEETVHVSEIAGIYVVNVLIGDRQMSKKIAVQQ